MSNYDGPSYQNGRNTPKKFKFPFYSDTDKVSQKEKNETLNETKKIKDKPVKRSREGHYSAPEAVFSEFLTRNDAYSRMETKAAEKKEQREFEERKKRIEQRILDKENIRKSIEKTPTALTDSRSSTPFKVQKVPSPVYGFKQEKKVDSSGIDYQKMEKALKKEFDTFILLATEAEIQENEFEEPDNTALLTFDTEGDLVEEESIELVEPDSKELDEVFINEAILEEIVEEETELPEEEFSEVSSEEKEDKHSKRLQRSLQGMIEEEQDIHLNRGTNVARYFGEAVEKLPEEINGETEETVADPIEVDESDSDLEIQAALSRFNYLSQQLQEVSTPSHDESAETLDEDEPPLDEEYLKSLEISEEASDFGWDDGELEEEEFIIEPQLNEVEISEEDPISEEQASEVSEIPQAINPTKIELPSMNSISEKEEQDLRQYHLPPLNLLNPPVEFENSSVDDWVLEQAELLNETLDAFGVDAQVIGWTIGPAVTQFELQLGRGVKVNKITNLSDDLKLALAAKDIRIEAPIPGKSSVGVEIPNCNSRPVMLSEVMNSQAFKESKSPLTVALGVNLAGEAMVTTIEKMPHGLIAGATGSGKSVFINSLLISILYKAKPSEVKLILIDPKAVELAPYNDIPHLLSPVISEPKAAAEALKWAVDEMEERYQKLAAAGVRNIERFNEKAEETGEFGLKIPYIVIIIDELADLMMVASSEVQDYIARITQKARAAGIHLLVATQRPSVDVITGTIKNNIPTRVAFMVSSQIDSRTILDIGGAEKLLGRGDMLFMENGSGRPIRIQGTYVENEIDTIVKHVKEQRGPNYLFEPETLLAKLELVEGQDELFETILAFIANEETVSVSLLQRKFKIGFNRASNLIEALESQNLISENKGSKPRDVFLTQAEYEKNYL
ncbi:DNA translocase FtsK [Carnobacterium maltaromaticum]|uniref:DNA translocase FtsK n=1 Tax=Carnobacterium maltaromaticum TaxID=2751 RepID=UPI000C75C7B9|nr:DNA translocase FtsK [Carnobacterium maltaromaticum]PLS33865.1 DNA translocase FtsK [Carnobacterium maltaromaticum]PLS35846.1 DNA translocase FtsK [Carnobacterium maltaromaticum]PLS36296.1 DNA translocase FtsK [Carnobacterium maltaromaticum]PLS42989.1 DNA translocase FtsK [Carnobacterium maltaromaticum]PLS48799.1 DNA translocase FtsK [Carnobacterium maltaromaticum]